MDYIRYAIAVIFGGFGLWIFVMNWIIFWNGFVKRKHSSWAPLVAGSFLCVAFLIIPHNPYRRLCWLAFLIDWGSFPGIAFTIYYFIKERHSF